MGTKSMVDIYDEAVAGMAALFPDHRRLPEPYVVEENNDQYLDKGWGIRFTQEENLQFFITTAQMYLVTFDFPLTRRFHSRDHDVAKAEAAEKELLADVQTLMDSVHKTELGVTDVVGIQIAAIGTERIRAQKSNIIVMTPTVTFQFMRQ